MKATRSRLLPSPATALLVAASAALLAAACKSRVALPTPPVPAQDYADSGVPFNPDEVVPNAAFTDFAAMTAAQVQSFLEKDPYSGASFLATYQSNGVLFSSAVASVAQTYRINPIVLLVAVESVGGLVADSRYPQPASVVDYLFGCGCTVPADAAACGSATAGLDVQLACYASSLRTSLDEIAESGQTAGGWGPAVTTTSVDGISVSPADASTAALYQYDPVVGTGRFGNSLFWNIWSEYTRDLSYADPEGATGAVAQIGDPCLSASDCAYANAVCATGSGYPGGMCTSMCSGSCESVGADAFCADFTEGGFCLAICNPTVPASCRSGYGCTLVKPSGAPSGTAPENVCTPN